MGSQAMLALLQRGHQPLSTSPEPHGSRASLGALLLPGTVAGQDMSSVPVLVCAAPHTHLHFPFQGQGVKGTLLPKKVLFVVLERGFLGLCCLRAQSFLWHGYPERTWDALFTSSLISVLRLQNWDNGLKIVVFCLLHTRQWHLFTLLGRQ